LGWLESEDLMKITGCHSLSSSRFWLSNAFGGLTLCLLLALSSQLGSAQTSAQPDSTPSVSTPATTAASPSATKEDDQYRIGPGDVLDIRFYNRPLLSRDAVRVDGHGMIRMPLVEGEIRAACLTENELSAEIASRYLKFYRNPHIDVFIKEYQSEPVAVIGAVNTPGRFQLQRRVRLLELLAFANGPAEKSGQTIQIVHASSISICDESPRSSEDMAASKFVSYKLSDTLRGDEQSNPFIQPGDIISLPDADQIYVVGNVFRPSAIPLKEPITISRAIAMAGGTMRDTKSDRVRIVRQSPGATSKQEIYVDLKAIDKHLAEDIALQANDIVDVPVSGGKTFLRSLLGTVAPSVAQLPVRVIP
jgi:polysaccharide export outer membrane protein